METNNKIITDTTKKSSCHFSISKSRFKFIIDQIQTKLNKSYEQSHSQSLTSILKKTSTHSVQKSKILPQFFFNSYFQKRKTRQQKQNENRISINLQFNKLILNKKNKFVQHSPNHKDLMLYLPELSVPLKNIKNTQKTSKLEKSSSRWRVNPLLSQNSLFITTDTKSLLKADNKKSLLVTQNNKNQKETKNDNKFKKIKTDQIIFKQKTTYQPTFKFNENKNDNKNEQKLLRMRKLKIFTQNSQQERILNEKKRTEKGMLKTLTEIKSFK